MISTEIYIFMCCHGLSFDIKAEQLEIANEVSFVFSVLVNPGKEGKSRTKRKSQHKIY